MALASKLKPRSTNQNFSENWKNIPRGVDSDEFFEFLAEQTVRFYGEARELFSAIQHECTIVKFPVMRSAPNCEYQWQDPPEFKTPIAVSAPEYMNYLFLWIQKHLDNEKIFVRTQDKKFPSNFKSIVIQIIRRTYRVYAHIFHNQLDPLIEVGKEDFFKESFEHLYLWVKEFSIIPEKELAPTEDLVKHLEL